MKHIDKTGFNMASHEHKSEKLRVIVSDGSFRNQMIYNRIRKLREKNGEVYSVKVPEWIREFEGPPHELVKTINSLISGVAYIERSTSYSLTRVNRRYGHYMYFDEIEDAVACKLLWH